VTDARPRPSTNPRDQVSATKIDSRNDMPRTQERSELARLLSALRVPQTGHTTKKSRQYFFQLKELIIALPTTKNSQR
jgi:hypothetical protein